MTVLREVTLDVRGLVPCEPMARILAYLDGLPAGTRLCALLDREPLPLLPLLEQRGWAWQMDQPQPGCCELRVWRRDAPAGQARS